MKPTCSFAPNFNIVLAHQLPIVQKPITHRHQWSANLSTLFKGKRVALQVKGTFTVQQIFDDILGCNKKLVCFFKNVVVENVVVDGSHRPMKLMIDLTRFKMQSFENILKGTLLGSSNQDVLATPFYATRSLEPPRNASIPTPLAQQVEAKLDDSNIVIRELDDEWDWVDVEEGLEPWNIVELTENGSFESSQRNKFSLRENEWDLTSYIPSLFDGDEELLDNSAIGFKEGKIVSLEALSKNEKLQVPAVFFHLLGETYGYPYIAHVINLRYNIAQRHVLTLGDVKRILVGVAANVTISNLQLLFNTIQDKEAHQLPMHCSNYLKKHYPDEYRSLKESECFQDLDAKLLGCLLSAFRTVPVDEKTRRPILSLISNNPPKMEHGFPMVHDFKMLELLEQWKQLRLDLDQYPLAISEYVGKSLAYCELNYGMIVVLPDQENRATYYQVYSRLQRRKDGVIAYLITPINRKKGEEKNIHLVFRGTNPNPKGLDSGASILRDTSSSGIGKQTFDAREREILKMVQDYLKETDHHRTELTISGHSLGGVDTQRAVVAVLERLSRSEPDHVLRKLSKLTFITHNSPRGEPELNKRLRSAVETINQKEIPIQVNQRHVRFFDEAYEDTIQNFGNILVGADFDGSSGKKEVFAKAPFYHRQLINVVLEANEGFFPGFSKRHCTRIWNQAQRQCGWKIETLDGINEKDRLIIEKVLTKGYHWNSSEMSSMGYCAHLVNWYAFPLFFGLPRYALHAAVHTLHGVGLMGHRITQPPNDPIRGET